MNRLLVSLLLAGTVAACAPTEWHLPGGVASAADHARFSADDGRCRLLARSADHGFYANGSNALVAIAAAGYLLGTAAEMQAIYTNCMQASGYLPGREISPAEL